METFLHSISLADVKDFLLIVAACVGAYVSISTFTGKIKDKRFQPIQAALDEIKVQNTMILKVQLAMASDLETEGKVNGKTQEALNELQEYIIKTINK